MMGTLEMESEIVTTTKKGIEILLTESKKVENNSNNVEIDSVMKDDVAVAIESLSIVDTIPEYLYDNDSSSSDDIIHETKNEVSSIGKNQIVTATIKDPKTIMSQIKNLECLFTWYIKPNNENNLILLIQNKYGEYNLNIQSSEFTLERYIGNLIISYELFHKNEPELAQFKLLAIQDWLENLDKGTDEFYLSINTGLHHVVKATFIHMLYITNLTEECKWILNDVVLYSHLNIKSKATINAIRGAILTEYGANNMIYLKRACSNAKRACELDPTTSHWFYIYSLALTAIRQFFHKSTPNICEINAINQACMLSNGKNALFNYQQLSLCRYDTVRNYNRDNNKNQQHEKCVSVVKNIISMDPKDPLLVVKCARILMTLPNMVLEFNLGKQCLMKAFELAPNDETVLKAISEAVNPYKNNTKPKTSINKPEQPPLRTKISKLTIDLKCIKKKHMNGEDPVSYLINLVSKYDGLEQSKILAQLCSYLILYTNNLKLGIDQFIKLIEQPGIANNAIITKHSTVMGSQEINFNLSELIFNEIRLATNISGISAEDTIYYYKMLAKIMETCNLNIKGIDSSMKVKLIADLTTVQFKTESSPRVYIGKRYNFKKKCI
ncbi:uncharacterized protein LOC114128803 [Aphis gossypii]|nr:uncharacterized protein LOC114128803 [Aphis gossypii]